ncbi:MAG: hypothetical protein AAFZ18_08610 [Myxococcota bacterium]
MNKLRTLPALLSLAGLSMAAACGGSEDTEVEVANAEFALTSTTDCTQAFATRAFLIRLTEEKGWGDEEISAFCAEVDAVAATYAESSTLTVMTVAGIGQLQGETLQTAYYVGVAGYDLTAVQSWLGEVRASQAVRPCTREAVSLARQSGLQEGFMRRCLEDETGAAYPEPIFRQTRSRSGLDGVGEAAAGSAVSLAIYNAPGRGTVVGFLAGSFAAQAEPPYGAFLGCGAVAGFDAVAEQGAFSYVCVAAEH